MEQVLSPSTMSEESRRNLIHDSLVELRCHFTWELVIKDDYMPDLEAKILETEFLDTNYNMGMHNLMAYVRHLKEVSILLPHIAAHFPYECAFGVHDLYHQSSSILIKGHLTWEG